MWLEQGDEDGDCDQRSVGEPVWGVLVYPKWMQAQVCYVQKRNRSVRTWTNSQRMLIEERHRTSCHVPAVDEINHLQSLF